MIFQGLISYYFNLVAPKGQGVALDPCAYNSMASTKNCSRIKYEDVYSIHFTVCQKPWECHRGRGVCADFHTAWWKIRSDMERVHGLEAAPRCCHGCKTRRYSTIDTSAISFFKS